MNSEPYRAPLISLSDAEITNLFRAIPGLTASWAETAGSEPGPLERGEPQALAALRAAMAARHDRLLAGLARTGLPVILETLDAAEAGDEGPAELALIAGHVFGPTTAPLFLTAVAAGSDPLAAEVAGHLAELKEHAGRVAEPVQPDAKEPPVPVLAERTRELSAQVAPLASALRAAATEVDAGRPVSGAGEDLALWSAMVRQLLADAAPVVPADDLTALGTGLAGLAARTRERDRKRQEALRGARLLREQGLSDLARDVLAAEGIDVPEDWQEAPARAGDRVTAEPEEPPSEPRQPEPPPEPALPELVVPEPALPEPVVPEPVVPEESGATRFAAEKQQAEPGTPGQPDTLQFPWDYGTPPLLASLISGQRSVLAVCVAEAADETSVRQRLLRFFCAAYSCSPTALELQLPNLAPSDSEVRQMSPDECRVLLAAALRAGLAIGYSPVDLLSLIDRADLRQGSIRMVVEAATEAVRRGYRRDAGTPMVRHAELAREWATFEAEAQLLQKSLAQRTVNLQRASSVLHWMVRQDQPVGRVLALAARLAAAGASVAAADAQDDEWGQIERMAADLSSPAGRSRLIAAADKAVSTSKQLRKPIIAGARTRLDGSLCEVCDLLVRFLGIRSALRVSSSQADLQTADELFRAIDQVPANGEALTVGDAALQQLTQWLRASAPSADGASVDELIRVELAPLYEIPRDANGWPIRPATLAETGELLAGRDLITVVRGYLGTGNIVAARGIIAADDHPDQALDDEVLRGSREAQTRHEQALDSLDRIAARLRAVYEDEMARAFIVRAEQLRVAPAGRFDLTIRRLRQLAQEGNSQLRDFREGLRKRALDCPCGEADRSRIVQLIDDEDEILAVEFLTMAEAGLELPEVGEQHGDDFSDFFPRMVDVAVTATRTRADAVAAVREAAGVTADPSNRNLAFGLEAWRELKRSKRAAPGDRFRQCVADVLRMLGLVPRDQTWLQELSKTHRSGYATFKVKATPIDRSYVPGLGTQVHGNYDLTLVWDAVTPARLLDFVDESRRTEANVILYFNTLDPDQRLTLRRLTSPAGGKGFSPVIIDEPVIGWLSARAEPGWRFTQRVTLPFTTINPYTPFAGGEVPDEVFVGRAQERAAIESPTGPMFVYGGRQLGKSALLRRVERLFSDAPPPRLPGAAQPRSGRVAVYLDLKAASIGEAQEPAALWNVLAQRLRDVGVLPMRAGRGTGPDAVIQQLSAWLSADDGNRLLLLLDEADNFLTADSQANQPGTGAEFPTLQHLKGLMETSGRRFKAVFAGLHQVQRFHDSSNTPVAHGGDDILIGPLRSMDAYSLVVDPMNALGYRFSSPELVWRLLLFTNYQASLVQIVCEALVRELSRRQLPRDGGRIQVRSQDIEAVYAKREVRDLIVQRFRWTINLDNRYRVIALVVALRSLDSDPGETFTPEELNEDCEVFWPAGFSSGVLTSKEFRRYLEEMVGLGVLHRQGEQYGLRSPNIISLLGTRQSLDQELAEAPRHLELQYEYNPTMNRRILGQSTELWAPRSPLTDQDIASLLGLGGRHGGRVQVVTGSMALTVDRAARVIKDVATEQGIRCEVVAAAEIGGAIAGARSRLHLVVDLSGSGQADASLAELCTRLASRHQVTATVIVGPPGLPVPGEAVESGDVTPIRRWSIEGLRSWHESPFPTPDLRARLHRVTSGWPRLVEATMRAISHGIPSEDALQQVIGQLAEPVFARQHLAACGIEPEVAARWATAQALDGDDGLIEAFPASVAELTEALGTDADDVIERLLALDVVESTPDGWVLDRAVVAAAMTLRQG